MNAGIDRARAWALLRDYNSDPFHLQHALTVEGVMGWFARDLGYGDDEEFWSLAGLLHDIDFERYPQEHCVKAPELLRLAGVSEACIHAVICHGWGLTTIDAKPEHEMEKVLFASDELSGLIWAAAIIRPSKSVKDMELKSLKKKYKAQGFAAGCNRGVIEKGAALLGWELDTLLDKTIRAMRSCEDAVNTAIAAISRE
ncbi:MAG: hydrolase [Treponema sp.]|jgi:predicted hydrolase (HD superfamily)|nr:hydrolase [Treponema sp.]